jgi:hypothetical protein
MLDFRYHALSLMAVFLALAIGIVLGVTIGDSLLSDAERSLRSNLHGEVVAARDKATKAESDVSGRDRMLDQLYPGLVRNRLNGERVTLVSWGPLAGGIEGGVRDAVHNGGGKIDSIAVFDRVLTELKTALGPSDYALQTADDASLARLGRSLADGLIGDGRLGKTLRQALPDRFKGRFLRGDAIVFYEAPAPKDGSDADGVRERSGDPAAKIEAAMLDELKTRTLAVVGVEPATADPSQIPRYQSLKLTTVDSVDKAGGKIALVFALTGATGNFGFKGSAKQPLPPGVPGP